MRILIASQTYLPGTNGEAVFTIQLAEGLAQAGHDVMAVIPSEREFSYQERIQGVHVCGVASVHLRFLHPATYFTPLPDRAVSRAFDAFQPEVVHLQDHYPLCQSVLHAARERHLPVLGTNHFLPENLIFNFAPNLLKHQRPPTWLTYALWDTMRMVFNQLDLITVPTETAAQILRQQSLYTPVMAVSCGVDTRRFRPRPDLNQAEVRRAYGFDADQPLFLYVGRLDWEKRIDVILRALHRRPHADLQFGIAGSGGSAVPKLRALASELGLGPRVRFIGFVPAPDLPRLLNSAEVFVMPSPEELQSIATIEAMATGKPVLAANARALPELVTTGVNGCLFRAGDPDDAARQIGLLLDKRAEWTKMGQASLERAQLHSLAATLRRYESLYQSLLTARRSVPASPASRKASAYLPRGIQHLIANVRAVRRPPPTPAPR